MQYLPVAEIQRLVNFLFGYLRITLKCFTHIPLHSRTRSLRIPNQPFNPVEATPSTKYFCKIRNTISTGINDNTEPAIIKP